MEHMALILLLVVHVSVRNKKYEVKHKWFQMRIVHTLLPRKWVCSMIIDYYFRHIVKDSMTQWKM